MAQRQVIAIVDDDALMRETLKDLLDSAGYTSAVFSSAQGFLKSKRLATFACLITDMRMPGATGIELHQKLVNAGHAIPTILITAYPDETVRARRSGPGSSATCRSRSRPMRCSPASMRPWRGA